jgi:hypothetical protein
MQEICGTLGPGVLPEALRQVFAGSRTGGLHVVHGPDRCVFEFEGGLIEDCDTSIPGFHLGDVLVRVGFLGEAERDDCLEIAALSGQDLAETLLRHSVLDLDRLSQGLSIQLRDVLARALGWAEGRYSFVAAPPPAASSGDSLVRPRIDPRAVMMDAVWSMSGAPLLKELVGPLGRKVRPATSDRLSGLDLKLGATDAFLLTRVNGVATLEDMLRASPVAQEETMVSLAGLISVGALEVECGEPEPKTTAEVYKSEMVSLAARLHAADPHEVLGVNPAARTEDIRANYVHLLKICDPAAEGDPAMKPLRERMTELLNQAFKQIERVRAHARTPLPQLTPAQTLRNVPPPTVVLGPSHEPEAARVDPANAIELADAAFADGKIHEALALLHDAIPDLSGRARRSARVRLCRILLGVPNGSKLAMDELKTAVAEDPGNTEAHVLLGSLYREAGSSALATAAFQRALSLDPRNAAARAALQTSPTGNSQTSGRSAIGPLLKKLFRR